MRVSLVELEAAIRASWGPDTCHTPAQFGDGFEVGEPEVRLRNKPMPPQHEAQYLTLAARVKDRLHLDGYMPMPPGPAV